MLSGEVRSDVRRVQQYGLAGHPPAGSECVVVCVGGNRDLPVIVAADDGATRFGGLKSGEVAVYNARGDVLHLKEDGEVELVCKRFVVRAEEAIELHSPSIDLEEN
jgi:phage baseplate assembly protein V